MPSAVLIAALGAVRVTDKEERPPPAEAEGTLLPPSAGFLRVLATPWAEVSVDGQRVDVTPFARAIPLASGKHWVTFSHPAAPPITQRISIEAGKTVTLDVTMDVAGDAGTDH